MSQFQAVDSTVVPNLGAPMYGSMYSPTGQTLAITTQNVYAGITTFSEETAVGVTTDVADAAGDHFIIPVGGAGDYLIVASASGQTATASETFQFAIAVDGTADTNFLFTLDDQGDGDQMAGGITAIKTLADSAEVTLYGVNLSGTGNFNLNGASISIYRVA